MRTYPLRPYLVLVLACLLALLLFLIGIAVPQAHFWGSFLLPVVVVFLWGRRRDIYLVTALSSVLLVASYWTDGTAALGDFVIYHLLPLVVLWGAAWLLAQRQVMQQQFAHSKQDLEEQVAARTAELRASEQRFRLLAENAGDLIWTVDMDGNMTYTSPAAQRVRGVTRQEEQSASWFDRLPPAAAAHAAAALQADLAALRAGEPVDATPRAAPTYRKDGTIMWTETVMSAMYDDGGRPVGLCGTTRDITERKRLEEMVNRLAAIVESSSDAIVSTDLEGRVVSWNRSAEQLYGPSAAKAIGCPIYELLPPDPAAEEAVVVAKVRSGATVPVADRVITKADGTRIDLSIILSPVKDAYGAVVGMASIARDITARKQAEARLREANQRLQLATVAAGIGVWAVNLADNSLEWDERMYELHAVTPEERRAGISHDFWRARIHPDDLALAGPGRENLGRLGRQWSGAYRVVLSGGAVRHIQANALVEYDPGGSPFRIVGINRDISDQVAYDRLLQDTNAVLEQRVAERTADLQFALANLRRANQLKDEFMAMISHELRTPLAGVLSMTELLGDQIAGPLSPRQATYVRGITESGERLLAVINGILSYTHLLGGKVKLHAEACDLAYLLGTCATSQQHKAAEKHQSISVTVAQPGLAITADPTALAEVLKRLLDNAVKFTPDGGRIGLEAHPSITPGAVDLVVWDTGIGIPPDQLDRVFHAFTQADARLSRSHEGLGLGLAYVDEMVRQLGGTIYLASEPGAGSCFTITLPAGSA